MNLLYEEGVAATGQPRKSWLMRTWQQREAVAEGLAEWQANPYYVAGRVTVPALADTFACQCFFNRWLAGGRGLAALAGAALYICCGRVVMVSGWVGGWVGRSV